MIDRLSGYVYSLIAGSFLTSIVLALTPEGKGRQTVRFAAGLLMTILLLQPLTTLRPEKLAERLAAERLRMAGVPEQGELREAVYNSFIMRETEEYIWNAAGRLGIPELGVRITLRDGTECPYPWEIYLRGTVTQAQRETLTKQIEYELGVPAERQYWSGNDAGESEKTAG